MEDKKKIKEALSRAIINTNAELKGTEHNLIINYPNQRLQANFANEIADMDKAIDCKRFAGIRYVYSMKRFRAEAGRKHIGYYLTVEEALGARNKYIIENDLEKKYPIQSTNQRKPKRMISSK